MTPIITKAKNIYEGLLIGFLWTIFCRLITISSAFIEKTFRKVFPLKPVQKDVGTDPDPVDCFYDDEESFYDDAEESFVKVDVEEINQDPLGYSEVLDSIILKHLESHRDFGYELFTKIKNGKIAKTDHYTGHLKLTGSHDGKYVMFTDKRLIIVTRKGKVKWQRFSEDTNGSPNISLHGTKTNELTIGYKKPKNIFKPKLSWRPFQSTIIQKKDSKILHIDKTPYEVLMYSLWNKVISCSF